MTPRIVAGRRRRSALGLPTLLLALLLLAVMGVGGYAYVTGEVPAFLARGPLFGRLARATDQLPAGRVAVPVAGRAIPAYAKVSTSDLLEPGMDRLSVRYLDPERLDPAVLRDLGRIRGRVLARDKGAGYAFTEDDFLPEGTRPGLVAGIPPGKRGYRVDLERIPGLYGLNPGDRFDLVSALPVEEPRNDRQLTTLGGVHASALVLDARMRNAFKRATVDVIVADGSVVRGIETRQVPYTQNTLTRGAQVRTRPVQEIIIAIGPDEVAGLEQALALKAQISCVPRSGRPDDVAVETAELRPPSPLEGFGGSAFSIVEVIQGQERALVPVPVAPAGHR